MTQNGDDPFDIAAAHWARLQSGMATSAEQAAIAAWCDAAPAHRAAMDAVQQGWDSAGRAEGDDAITAMIARMHARQAQAAVPLPARRPWRTALLAASLTALLAVPATLWFNARPVEHPVPPAVSGEQVARAEGTRLFSPAGRRRTMQLPDGSRVILDADSAIRFAFSTDRRAVVLEAGRAFFAVQKDSKRPFSVSAGNLTATALGTAFDVSLLSSREQVTTTQGLVRVVTLTPGRDGSRATLLPAGMRLTRRDESVSVDPVDVTRESAWRDGRIVFTGRCLSDVAAEMNRYGSGRLEVRDDAARIAISGVFDIDNADGLAEALEQQGLVHVSRSADRIILTHGDQIMPGDCAIRG
jgi:transmembrane sensor